MLTWISLALANPTGQLSQQEERLVVLVDPGEGWTFAEEPPRVRVLVGMTGIRNGVSVWSTEFPAPYVHVMGYGEPTDVTLEASYKACRKDDGICKPFTVKGSTPFGSTERFALDPHPSPAAFATAVAEEEKRKATPSPKPKGPKGYVKALMDTSSSKALKKARRRAAERDVPLLVVVGFIGCDPCRFLARDVLYAKQDPARLERVEWVMVNQFSDIKGELAAWEVTNSPTALLLVDDTIVARRRGYARKDSWVDWLDEALTSVE